jgi:hypothetical protein
MSDTSTNLTLPYLFGGQAQKHVTVNESLRRLDAIVQLAVASATASTQPANPADGAVHIVPPGKSGAQWSSFSDHSLAYYRDGSWEQIIPREGWLAHARDTDQLLHFTGAAWTMYAPGQALAVSSSDRLLGRASAGAGPAEEIACTAAGRALIDDANASAQRTTLGLGTAAVKNTGGSGDAVPLLNAVNTWSATQVIQPAGYQGLSIRAKASGGAPTMIKFETSAGVIRYDMQVGDDASGNPFGLNFYNASGIYAATPISVNASTGRLTLGALGSSLVAGADNTHNLGSAANRWATVYAATGTINTSDAREKTPLRPFSAAELRAVRRVMAGAGMYRWLSSVEEKGEAARLHAGVTAQAVAEAFAAEGLDAERYALFCRDEPNDGEGGESERLGLRHDQLLLMMLVAIMPR